MKVLVSDTSVIVDLERGALVDSCFRLPFEFAVPDLLYSRELEQYGGPDLVKLGLRVEELTAPELAAVQGLRCASIAIAKRFDGALRDAHADPS